MTKRLGMGGGLKEIEDSLGVGRPPHLRGVNGWDAVLLWRAYKARGDIEALRFLVEYNLYDAFQLRAVADRAFNRAAERLHWPDRVQPWDRGVVLYDLSRLLLALEQTPVDRARAEASRRGVLNSDEGPDAGTYCGGDQPGPLGWPDGGH